ncbi:MAG: hypothetical protein IJC59_01310, partial [Lachnospiraceae bacterium]|nr:hypothetical protein [Lachnospiraceae bacterium]
MGITIPAKNDYSFLFSNLNNTSQSGSLYGINLADYACIKNGSYSKLLKAYYAKTDSEDSSASSSVTNSLVSDKKEKLAKSELNSLKGTAEDVETSADRLMERGRDSLFAKKDIETTAEDGTKTVTYDYDRNKIYGAVEDLIKDYNTLLDKGGDSSSTSVLGDTLNMIKTVNSFSSQMKEVGITIGSDNTLSIDKESFLAADMEK